MIPELKCPKCGKYTIYEQCQVCGTLNNDAYHDFECAGEMEIWCSNCDYYADNKEQYLLDTGEYEIEPGSGELIKIDTTTENTENTENE